jgi:hypothetical protein
LRQWVTRSRGLRERPISREWFITMNELEQLTCDVRGFATEVRTLGYSSVAGGHENRFLELSERMIRHAPGGPAQSLKEATRPVLVGAGQF